MTPLALLLLAAAQTTVSARGDGVVDIDLDDAAAAAMPEDALLAAPGVALVHGGGPLSPTRILVRGLSGPRVGALLDGLSLADPAEAVVDAGALPLALVDDAALDVGHGVGGALKLRTPRTPGVLARASAGSLSFARFTGRSVVPAAEDGAVLLGVDVATTRGDFTFLPATPLGAVADVPAVRDNNDQRRATLLAAARAGHEVVTDVVAIAAGHEGGVPGLLSSPFADLRARRGLVGARLDLRAATALGRVRLSSHARAAHQETESRLFGREVLESASGGAGAGVENLALSETVRLDVMSGADVTTLVGGAFSRVEADAGVAGRMPLGPLRLRADVHARATSDRGLLYAGGAGAAIGDPLSVSLGLRRRSRAPTLDELYAPRGLVLGNPELRPEATNDVELGVSYQAADVVIHAAAFAGFLEDAILYLNRNAYEIAPQNTGAAWRTGVELSATIAPSPFLALRITSAALASRVDVTGAPLPAPPFVGRSALRIGEERGARLDVQMRSRAAAPSNLFGTLSAPGYSLIDLAAALPLAPGLELRAAIQNVLDVLDARDQNLLPLPGRLFFVALEVRR